MRGNRRRRKCRGRKRSISLAKFARIGHFISFTVQSITFTSRVFATQIRRRLRAYLIQVIT